MPSLETSFFDRLRPAPFIGAGLFMINRFFFSVICPLQEMQKA